VRILAIRGRNIASLVDFEVNFQAEPLRSAGIFAIVGPTGSGKSSLLDALCLALYQKAPRLDGLTGREAHIGGISQSDIKNLLRRGCDTGFAECDFQGGDGRGYRARWGYRAPKRSGAAVQEELSLVRLDDNQVLVGGANRKGEFQSRVQELVGLSYGQFTRTALLAQGRFAEFLRSDERERTALLERLTSTEIYGRISQKVFEHARAARAARDQLEHERQNLSQLSVEEREIRKLRLSELRQGIPDLERQSQALQSLWEGLGRQEALRHTQRQLQAEFEAMQPQLKEATRQLEEARQHDVQARARREEQRPQLEEARRLDSQLHSAQERLEERKTALKRLKEMLAALEAEASARAAEAVKLRQELQKREDWLQLRQAKLEPLAVDWPRWRELLRQAARERAALEQGIQRLSEVQASLAESLGNRERLEQELSKSPLPEELTAESAHAHLEAASARLDALGALLPWLESAKEIEALDKEILQVKAQEQPLQACLASNIAAWETARRLLDATRTALSENVEHLRNALKPEQPCPVCGSLAHPWESQAPAFDALLTAHQQEEARTREAAAQTRADLEKLHALLQMKDEARAHAAARQAAMVIEPDLRAEAQAAPDPVVWTRNEIATVQAEKAVLLETFKALQERDRLRSELQASAVRAAAQEELCGQASRELERTRGALEEAELSLDVPFQGQAWRESFHGNPDFLPQLEARMGQFLEMRDAAESLRQKLETLAAGSEARTAALEERRSESQEAAQEAETAHAAHQALSRARSALFSGKPVVEVENALEAGIQEAQGHIESFQRKLQEQERKSSELSGKVAQLRQQEEQEAQAARQQIEQLSLAAAPEAPSEAARARLAESLAELSQKREEHARLELEISQDEAVRVRAEALGQELETARTSLEAWDLLSEQIGSSDGQRFSRIAQQYTLEILLEEANRQLTTIAPRYALEMLQDSMHFGVIDHESYDELRPVHTLSGGESFLISLGLALGLSHMAGGDLSVETLFIDEGFGTLDSESLRHVLSALGSLQAQGRKVGLITHVEEMKAEIPVHVEIVPLGQGSSRVRVVG
jgi:exonuclease SbcC